MGKPRMIAETGAGQHGVATATACGAVRPAVRGLHGRRGRRAPGAQRRCACSCSARRSTPVESGTRTLKDAMNEALRDWVTNVRDTYYCSARVAGPASVSDDRARPPARDRPRGARADPRARRAAARRAWSRASAAARTRSGCSRAFVDDASVQLFGVEAAGEGIDDRPPRGDARRRARRRAARQQELRAAGRRRPDQEAHSISAGPRLSRRRPRARVPGRTRAAPSTSPSPTTRRSPASSCCAHRGHPVRARDARTRSPPCTSCAATLGDGQRRASCACRAAATRTWQTVRAAAQGVAAERAMSRLARRVRARRAARTARRWSST